MLPEGASPTTAELPVLSMEPSEAEQPKSTMHVSAWFITRNITAKQISDYHSNLLE